MKTSLAFVISVSWVFLGGPLQAYSQQVPDVWAWLPNLAEFCAVSLSNGTISSCFGVPDDLSAIGSGVYFNNAAYMSFQNFSDPSQTNVAIAVSMETKAYMWTTVLPNFGNPVPTTFSFALQSALVGNGVDGFKIVNASGIFGNYWNVNSPVGFAAAYSQVRQQVWTVSNTLLMETNIQSNYNQWNNQYHITTFALAKKSPVIYGLMQAGDAVVLYAIHYPQMYWHFVGVATMMTIAPLTSGVLDSSDQYLTFMAIVPAGGQLITLSVKDASVVYSVPSPDKGIMLLEITM